MAISSAFNLDSENNTHREHDEATRNSDSNDHWY